MPQARIVSKARLKGVAVAALLATALAGCNFAPPYVAPSLTMPAAFKEAGPWTTAAPADALKRGFWWTSFGDETLSSLEEKVDTANPTLAAALAAFDQALPQGSGDARQSLAAASQALGREHHPPAADVVDRRLADPLGEPPRKARP